MNSPEITSAVLAEHRHDLRHEARRSALASIARCCAPSTWAAASRRVASAFSRSDRSAPCAC
jgi:hypothetical protein